MTLKFVVDNLENLDESVAALYSKHDDDKFYLKVDGAVSKSKLDEFRNNNIELMNKLETFKDVDVDKYTAMVQKQLEIEKKKMIPSAKVEEMVSERVKTMQSEYDTKEKDLSSRLDISNRQLESLLIDSTVRRGANDKKVLDTAVDDILLRAKSTFKIEDGKAIPYDGDGDIQYGKTGSDPMSVGEWLDGLSKTAPHLFKQSHGSGAQHQRGPGNIDTSKLSGTDKIRAALSEAS